MNSENFESTYALLVRSEEKERSILETTIYVLLIVSMIFSVLQVAFMRVTIPERLTPRNVAHNAMVESARI